MLEEFYVKLGSQPLSGLIKEEYKSSGTPIVSTSATSLRHLVLERLALFYSDRSKSNAEVSLDWLKKDKNFNVFQVGSINLKRTLKQGGMERTNSQAVSACVMKARGGVINLYVSTGVEMDMFEYVYQDFAIHSQLMKFVTQGRLGVGQGTVQESTTG
jgi:hypothetical protein